MIIITKSSIVAKWVTCKLRREGGRDWKEGFASRNRNLSISACTKCKRWKWHMSTTTTTHYKLQPNLAPYGSIVWRGCSALSVVSSTKQSNAIIAIAKLWKGLHLARIQKCLLNIRFWHLNPRYLPCSVSQNTSWAHRHAGSCDNGCRVDHKMITSCYLTEAQYVISSLLLLNSHGFTIPLSRSLIIENTFTTRTIKGEILAPWRVSAAIIDDLWKSFVTAA